MPNWTYNEIKFYSKEDFQKVVRDCFTHGDFDFNKIIPMPAKLNNTLEDSLLSGFRDFTNEFKRIGDPYKIVDEFATLYSRELTSDEKNRLVNSILNYKEFGAATWYDWSWNNWGTKWNSDESGINNKELKISFKTAWCPPFGIFEGLAKKYPDMICSIHSKNDWNGVGPYTGIFDIKINNGEINCKEHGIGLEDYYESWGGIVIKGSLRYNETLRQYEICPSGGINNRPLNDGDPIDLYDEKVGEWRPTMIVLKDDHWHLAGTELSGSGLEGLQVMIVVSEDDEYVSNTPEMDRGDSDV